MKNQFDRRKLWQNWAYGLHRQTCYGDITEELGYFCKLMDIKLVDESHNYKTAAVKKGALI